MWKRKSAVALKAAGSSPGMMMMDDHPSAGDDKKYTSLPKKVRGFFGMDETFPPHIVTMEF